jgi:hypothetical protein
MGERTDALLRKQMPSDASVIKRIDSWAIYFSNSTSSFYVMATEYHTGPLQLTKEDLLELTGIIEKQRNDLEKEIITDLENRLAKLLKKEEYKEIFKDATIKLIIPEK